MKTLLDIFEDFTSDDSVASGTKVVTMIPYTTVHPTDLEPASVIELDTNNGPWIAGGACLRWYQNQPVGDSDLDVFCRDAKQAADVMDRLRYWGRYIRKHESENATTFEYWDDKAENRWTIQVITKRYYNDMQEIIDNFDVSVCQIATDGKQWILGDHTARDIREKNLRMKLPLQPDAVKRLTKYWIYGYRPVDGLIEAIQDNPVGRWEFNPSEDYS